MWKALLTIVTGMILTQQVQAAALFNDPVSACTTLGCGASSFTGVLFYSRSTGQTPFTFLIFLGQGQCAYIGTSGLAELHTIGVTGPHGATGVVTTGTMARFTAPMLGFYEVGIAMDATEPTPRTDVFRIAYGRYAAGNANCPL